jgi:hypothetical protein
MPTDPAFQFEDTKGAIRIHYTTNSKSVIIVGLGMNMCIAKSARGKNV